MKSLAGARLALPFLIALLSAALGAGGVLLFVRPLPGSSAPRTQSLASGPLNDQAVYDRLEPSIVDVTADLRFAGRTTEGTGFVFNAPDGLVLTNNHVVRSATSVTATLAPTGKTYRARIVGTDARADIAVLQLLNAPPLKAAATGDSTDVMLGTPVLAIGNADGQGGAPTIAPGIVNSLDRTIDASDTSAGTAEVLSGMLQTSAQLEPGDSGGPLADAAGQVIGIDTAANPAGTPGPVGYAIPVHRALAIARQIAAGHPGPGIALGTGGFLGTVLPASATGSPQVQDEEERSTITNAGASPAAPICLATDAEAGVPAAVAPVRSGALVEGVLCGTPAAAAGVTGGDVIVRVAGQAVTSPDGLAKILATRTPGIEVPVTWADLAGVTRTVLVRLLPAPAP